jgi:hypothetical protein
MPNSGAICGTPMTCILKSLNISFDCPLTEWHWLQPSLAEEHERAALLLLGHCAQVAARESVDRRVGEDERELELGDGSREHRKIDRPACRNGRKSAPNNCRYAGVPLSLCNTTARMGSFRVPVESAAGRQAPMPSSNWLNSGAIVPAVQVNPATSTSSVGGMCAWAIDKVRDNRIVGSEPRRALGEREPEPLRVIERIAGNGRETAVPHQVRIERRVGREGRSALVARSRAMGTDNVVVLNSDRNGLCVAEGAARRMAAAARVVIVEPARLVEPEQATEIGERRIERAPEPGTNWAWIVPVNPALRRAACTLASRSSSASASAADVSNAVHTTAIGKCLTRDAPRTSLISSLP